MKTVKVRKLHDCDDPECKYGEVIKPGELARVISKKNYYQNGSWETFYFHPKCNIRFPGEVR